MVMRKRPVGLREQRNDVSAQLPQRLDGDETGDAIAAIDNDLEAPRERSVPLHDRLPVGREQVRVRLHAAARFRRQLAPIDHFMQSLDVVPEHRVVGQHHLEAVELGRIVRAGDLNAAVDVERLGREVQSGRRQLADINRHAARRRDSFAYAFGERTA